jgi:hypothetical protein
VAATAGCRTELSRLGRHLRQWRDVADIGMVPTPLGCFAAIT